MVAVGEDAKEIVPAKILRKLARRHYDEQTGNTFFGNLATIADIVCIRFPVLNFFQDCGGFDHDQIR